MAERHFDPRAMMVLAVEVMERSLAERRADNKASPLVGAVMVKPDGTFETACRGELRLGDHAEYTLLERKNRSSRLDDMVLFSTLEPCAPGARNHPKLSCAERIVLARIKEVWVGIEDPDPKVDRKGIRYLQDHGVEVRIFDADLQDRIREANKAFIEQAEERAAQEATKAATPQDLQLSSLEAAFAATNLGAFDRPALEAYRTATGAKELVDSPAFLQRLLWLGLLKEQEHPRGLAPTGFGLVLFGQEPRLHVPQAGLLGTIVFPDGREEPRDFDGPAVHVPEQVLAWLRDKLPAPIDRSYAQRKGVNDVLFELIREGVVNALVHRDYAIQGAKCQLVATQDKIVIRSPGMPVEPITLEQMYSLDPPALSRNPALHLVFSKMRLAEERGLGLKSMRERAAKAGLPLPAYSYKAPYLSLTINRTAEAALPDVKTGRLSDLSSAEREGWEWLVSQTVISAAEYQAATGTSPRTARSHLQRFTELGLLRRSGAARATRYEVVRS